MNAYVYATQLAAQACGTAVDTSVGYPKAGINVGGGIHVTPPFVTQTHFVAFKHPTLTEWAYLSDSVTDPILQAQAIALALPIATTLDSTWFPTVSIP
jgi:hypothetical protein